MEDIGNFSFIESKKKSESFSLRMYERIGVMIFLAAERRRRNIARLQALQQKMLSSSQSKSSLPFFNR